MLNKEEYLSDYLEPTGNFMLCDDSKVGEKVIGFKAKVLDKNNKIVDWDLYENFKKNKWTVINFYVKNFNALCLDEIKKLDKLKSNFKKLNANILIASTDSLESNLAWKESSLGNISISMMSDSNNIISKYFGTYVAIDGTTNRTTLIISPDGELLANYSTVPNVIKEGEEILKLLEKCQASQK